jgi:uncharacterized protein DUF937
VATNLVSYIMQFLTPDIVERIATALGLSRSDGQSGVSIAVPTLLAAFSGLADKPGGAQSLVNTIKQQSGVADNFPSMIGGSNQTSFIDRGSSLLTSLLGSHDLSSLGAAVGRNAGLGQTNAMSLLGMLGPLVLSLIGKQIGTRGVDVGSLTGLLASQRDQIAQALPAGMGQMLESAGLSGLVQAGGVAAPQVSRPSDYRSSASSDRPYSSTPRPPERSVRSEAGGPNWVYWLLPLLVLAGLLWYLFSQPPREGQQAQREATPPAQTQQERQAPQRPSTSQTTGQAPQTTAGQNVVVGGVDVKNSLGDSLADVRTSLQGVTDAESAQAALPKLDAAKNQIDHVSGLVGQLSDDQRKILAGVVNSALPQINQQTERLMAMSGVGDVLKPAIGPIKTKLAELSGQSATTGAGRQ